MKTIRYQIQTETAVLVSRLDGDPNTAVSHDHIPGSTLRGALIAAAVADGIPRSQVLAAAPFFFDGSTRFLNGYPSNGSDELYGPTPLSWYREKGDDQYIQDLAVQETTLDHPESPKGAYAHADYSGVSFYPSSDRRELSVHTFRNRRMGRPVAQKHAGEDPAGTVFRYDALGPYQTFVAHIVCETESVSSHLVKLIRRIQERDDPVRIGRSRRAGYGEVSWSITATDAAEALADRLPTPGKPLVITFLSDALIRDGSGAYSAEVSAVTRALEQRLPGSLGRHKRAFIQSDYAGGVDRTWGLPLPQALVVRKGSRVVYPYPEGVANWDALLWRGVGERLPEGFGDVTCKTPQAATFRVQRAGNVAVTAAFTDEDAHFDRDDAEHKIALNLSERLVRNRLDAWLVTAIASWEACIHDTITPHQLNRLRSVLLRAIDAIDGPGGWGPVADAAIADVRVAANQPDETGQPALRSTARKQIEQATVEKRGSRATRAPLDRWIEDRMRSVGDRPFAAILSDSTWDDVVSATAGGKLDVGWIRGEDGRSVPVRHETDSACLRAEYTLRLIDGVLARAMKQRKNKANKGDAG
ncbi:hypothetical protein HN766_11755 [Candidatus Poribacteria bacterium]|nr:hypothetical protein [Candidatus Poribacteria bacterium]